MKRVLFLLLTLSQLVASAIPWEDAYAQLSSVATQIPIPVTGSLVTFDTVNLIKNFDLTPNKDGLICKVEGTYVIYAGLQPSTLIRGINGYLDMWFVVNGVPIPGSNDRQYVDEISRVSLVTNTTLVELKAGDIFSTAFLGSQPDIGIVFIQSPLSSEPSVTSYILSVYRIR